MSYYPHANTGSTYPYGSYTTSAGYAQTPGAYPTTAYQTGYPTAGYTSTWPYPYSYYPTQQQAHQQAPVVAPRPPTSTPSTTAATTTATLPTVASAPIQVAPQRPLTSSFTYAPRESLAAGTSSRGFRKQASHRGLFTKELRNLMYGFGDDRNPSNDSVNVLEEILVEYIVDVCQTALAPGKKARLSIEDLRRALSRPADAKKLARMEELLFMQEDIKRARAQFEEDDLNAGGS
ncbi:transcription initiation factor IID, 18kD subunit-domain-containing protein [Cristinia sonorae]|uniref:Transcription initiation factor TFIID subunit 13 n=1 Tax=Cristinia sonorae TaxID=1940300 RepID=A0A8K0UYB2_9AGAR|nr:transcription initiation factor IID, 18kD subunit-domain-containing protein [Cristinia sonorae]